MANLTSATPTPGVNFSSPEIFKAQLIRANAEYQELKAERERLAEKLVNNRHSLDSGPKREAEKVKLEADERAVLERLHVWSVIIEQCVRALREAASPSEDRQQQLQPSWPR